MTLNENGENSPKNQSTVKWADIEKGIPPQQHGTYRRRNIDSAYLSFLKNMYIVHTNHPRVGMYDICIYIF